MTDISEAEQERLVLLIEECAEITQAATKVMRFGWEASVDHANGTTSVYHNRAQLTTEIGNLQAVILRMEEARDTNEFDLAVARVDHMKQIPMFTWHQPDSKLGKEVDDGSRS